MSTTTINWADATIYHFDHGEIDRSSPLFLGLMTELCETGALAGGYLSESAFERKAKLEESLSKEDDEALRRAEQREYLRQSYEARRAQLEATAGCAQAIVADAPLRITDEHRAARLETLRQARMRYTGT